MFSPEICRTQLVIRQIEEENLKTSSRKKCWPQVQSAQVIDSTMNKGVILDFEFNPNFY